MAPPACDRDYDHDRIHFSKWSPSLHRRCFWMQRIAIRELLLQCTNRDEGIGVISPEVLVQHILPHVEIAYS